MKSLEDRVVGFNKYNTIVYDTNCPYFGCDIIRLKRPRTAKKKLEAIKRLMFDFNKRYYYYGFNIDEETQSIIFWNQGSRWKIFDIHFYFDEFRII